MQPGELQGRKDSGLSDHRKHGAGDHFAERKRPRLIILFPTKIYVLVNIRSLSGSQHLGLGKSKAQKWCTAENA